MVSGRHLAFHEYISLLSATRTNIFIQDVPFASSANEMSTTHIKERTYGSQLKRERSRSRSPRGDDLSRTKRLDEDTTRQPDGSKKLENVGLGAKNRLKSMSIQMKLGSRDKVNKRKLTVASVFNQDSDSEPEEVPPEAKMRMRNIGRDTPTSSGPNSFGKTKQGFSDAKKVFEKNLKEAMENALADD